MLKNKKNEWEENEGQGNGIRRKGEREYKKTIERWEGKKNSGKERREWSAMERI